MKTYLMAAGVVAGFLLIAFIRYIDWDRPPIDVEQVGYRGTGMELPVNPREEADKVAANQAPPPPYELDTTGDRAGDVYENVQVLGDLPDAQFTRLMAAITEWVSPEQGCGYCHNLENLADDSVYTKIVARRMLQMTQHINASWTDHVQQTGVTCYTCHRGNPVPANVWSKDSGLPEAGGYSASRRGQNMAGTQVGLSSLPTDPFSPFLSGDTGIRVQSTAALPADNPSDIQQTEWTYGLMVHMSEGLGVNCTFCHNSRSFGNWAQSPPQRTTAYHGIRMVRDINGAYIDSLAAVFPDDRKGPEGDVLKTNCATCHNGVSKPLYGASMLSDFPSLSGN